MSLTDLLLNIFIFPKVYSFKLVFLKYKIFLFLIVFVIFLTTSFKNFSSSTILGNCSHNLFIFIRAFILISFKSKIVFKIAIASFLFISFSFWLQSLFCSYLALLVLRAFIQVHLVIILSPVLILIISPV